MSALIQILAGMCCGGALMFYRFAWAMNFAIGFVAAIVLIFGILWLGMVAEPGSALRSK